MIDPAGNPPHFSDQDAGRPGEPSSPQSPHAPSPSDPGGPWAPEPPAEPTNALAAPPPSGPRIGTIIAWLVIIGTVLAVAALPPLLEAFEPDRELTEEEAATTMALEEVMMRLQGRYLLGASRTLAAGPAAEQQMLDQLTTLDAGTPSNRMRIAVLAGEIAGPREALARLDLLEEDLSIAETEEEETRFNRLSEEQRTALAGLRTLYDVPESEDPAAARLSADQRDAIQNELGWFGRLAVHPKGTDDQATRDDLIGSAKAVVVTIFGAVMAVGGIGVVGFIGLIIMVVLAIVGSVKGGLAPGGGRSGLYAETFALWIVAFLLLTGVAGWIGMTIAPDAILLLTFFGFFASLIVLAWPVIRGVPWKTVREDIGLIGGRGGPFLQLLWGFAGYAMGLPILGVGLLITLALMLLVGGFGGAGGLFEPMTGPAHPIIVEVARGNLFVIAQVLLVGSVAAPIIEETMFRGVLYRHLRDASRGLGMAASIAFATLFNAFIFAVIHPQGIVAAPALMGLAIAFSLMREYRVSLIPAMVMHGVSNGIVLTIAAVALTI